MNWHLKNVSIYPKNSTSTLSQKLFASPTAEYRGTPFWSWNARLQKDILFWQIEALREMGFGGFHMHARTGLATAYLSDEFMDCVRGCADKAEQLKMIAWLYDEDRWPSGSAGGLVTKDHAYRARHLLWTATPYSGKAQEQDGDSAARGSRRENGTLLGRYEVTLKNGVLHSYRQLNEKDKPAKGTRVWYAYLEVAGNSSWYNNQAYVDTLNPMAIQKFVEVTHERYAQAVGDRFGSTVPAIFTDEPQFTHKGQLNNADEVRDIVLPFTDDFFDTYAQVYRQRLEEYLPELFWELSDGKASVARYRYHDHVAERFVAAFADTCGKWCLEHGIALTGHMMEEPSLRSQTAALGEAMRSYRAFQLPGIDMLCDRPEYTTAKQAQSAAHQYGRPGVLSELYGVTNWDFTFVGHKAQGDWQAALGVTVRVPHLAWVSMAGEAKRDYPAAIDYHSPWYREYPLVEDHFARINVAMTRGKPVIRVGVIHPVESYWLAFGPIQQTKLQREELERAFNDITNHLLFGLTDFNYISESLLPELNPKQTGKLFRAGQMAYDVVIVPSLRTIRATTLDRLEAFVKAGGRVIFAGEIPSLVDAKPSPRAARLAKKCTCIALSRGPLMAELDGVREIDVRHADGGRADTILSQLRADGKDRYLLLVNTDRIAGRDHCRVRVRGTWRPVQLDTFTGRTIRLPAEYADGWTTLTWSFAAHGHLLLSLTPGRAGAVKSLATPQLREVGRLADPVPVTLSEPNVLLLDQAQWRFGTSGDWQPLEETLRIGNLVRAQLKLPPCGGHIAQPWTDSEAEEILGTLQLRFVIESEVAIEGAHLALEEPQHATLTIDGQPAITDLCARVDGFWVDGAIQKVKLPPLASGRHELVVSYAYSRKRNIEWMYLLGDFGVRVAGRHARITAPVRQLTFGDYVSQGLPFYAGNVTYHCTMEGSGQAISLEVPQFSAPLLSVDVDGKLAGKIAFAPFRLDLGKLSAGAHRLDITAYGNRVNAFGAVHNADERLSWHGPHAWRQRDMAWSYEYQLKRAGIRTAPILRSV